MRSTGCLTILILLVELGQVSSSCNGSTHFDCLVGTLRRCIPLEWMCDNVNDCENGMDESHCAYLHHCPPGSMICRDGECIDQKFKCDGEADCSHGTDEVACHNENLDHLRPNPSPVPFVDTLEPAALRSSFQSRMLDMLVDDCFPPKHQCENSGPCIVASALCDGERDCPLGDDELNCTQTPATLLHHPLVADSPIVCRPNTMMCADEISCVPFHWVCDGEEDCTDGSDELGCDLDVVDRDVQSNQELCNDEEYRCVGVEGQCIALNKTCDGVNDCPLSDDEGVQCDECKKLQCSYRCHMSSTGPQCYCPPGSELTNEIYCTDKDECQTVEGKRCQHYCENGPNRFACKCAPGYTLGHDGSSCRLDRDQEGLLFVSLGTEVRSMPLFDPLSSRDSYEIAQSIGSHGTVRSADYMHRNHKLYLAVTRGPREGELAVSSNGVLRVLRENVIGIGQVAVDWIGGNVFITQKYPAVNPGISVCSLNGFFCKLLIRGRDSDESDASKRQSYTGLALHPQLGLMFWIDSFNGHHRVAMANMDGSNIRTLVESKLEYPSGLTIDPIRGDVYFGDVEREMIEKVNIETKERHIVLTSGVHHPYDLLFFNGFLYWSDWGTETLKVSELSWHHSSAHVIHSFNRFPYGLTMNHSMYQLSPTHDPCLLITCHWMCVSILGSDGQLHPQCICPDNYSPVLNSCVPNPIKEDNESTSFVSPALMREFCEANIGCLNGGSCEERVNEHGRVDRIYCSCAYPFEGDHCERRSEASHLLDEEESSSSMWISLLYTIFFIALLIALFFIAYKRSETISTMTKDTMERLSSVPMPTLPDVSPFVASLRSQTSKLHLPSRYTRSARTTGVTRTAFDNPLILDNSEGTSTASLGQEAASDCTIPASFSNPLYPETSSTAAPFSGIEVTYSNKFVH